MENRQPRPTPTDSGLACVMERNIQALLDRERDEEKKKRWQERLADAITRFAGSMLFVWLHLGLFGGWIVANLPGVPLPKWDPSFVVLAMFASVEAIFLSTFVMISQNRMAAKQDERAKLDLQVSLLAEHEVTQLITLVKAIAHRLDVDEAHNPELSELQRDVAPEKVLDTMRRIDGKPDEAAEPPTHDGCQT